MKIRHSHINLAHIYIYIYIYIYINFSITNLISLYLYNIFIELHYNIF